MAGPFRSGGAGLVAAGDPRLAGELAAASPAAVGGAGLPPGSEGSRNRAGNGCSPVMNGTLNRGGQVRQVIGARGSGV